MFSITPWNSPNGFLQRHYPTLQKTMNNSIFLSITLQDDLVDYTENLLFSQSLNYYNITHRLFLYNGTHYDAIPGVLECISNFRNRVCSPIPQPDTIPQPGNIPQPPVPIPQSESVPIPQPGSIPEPVPQPGNIPQPDSIPVPIPQPGSIPAPVPQPEPDSNNPSSPFSLTDPIIPTWAVIVTGGVAFVLAVALVVVWRKYRRIGYERINNTDFPMKK